MNLPLDRWLALRGTVDTAGLAFDAGVALDPPPPQPWLVEGLIPDNTVTLLSGDGGLGKSLLALQLGAAVAAGDLWLGHPTRPGAVVAVMCEDDTNEVRRRVRAIAASMNLGPGDLPDLLTHARVAEDATMVRFDPHGATGATTPFYNQVMASALNCNARLIILDSLYDFFAGNEISRVHARLFIAALRQMALRCNAAVLVTSHPSVAGLASGSGLSGSTAWNNACRSRLYLTAHKPAPGEREDLNRRTLTTMKSNYTARGHSLELVYRNGVFVPEPLATADRAKADAIALDALDTLTRQGRRCSPSRSSPSYFPKLAVAIADGKLSRPALADAMERLLAQGTLRVEDRSYSGKAYACLVRA